MGSHDEIGPERDTRSGPPRRRDRSEVDRWRWVGAPLEDQSEDADFRRQVADLAREVLASHVPGGEPNRATDRASTREPSRASTPEPDRDPTPEPDRDAIPLSRDHFDLRATALYQLARTYRSVARGLTNGRTDSRAGSGAVLVRDLVLMEVARSRPASLSGLRRRLGIPASTLSAVIDSSVRRGLVRRRRHPADRRRWLIDATPAGLQRADQAVRAWRAADEAVVGALSPIERDQLRWLLKRVASARRAADSPCPPGSATSIRSL